MATFHPENIWPAVHKDLAKKHRGAAIAVISYIGKDAPRILGLRRDDKLVCDASKEIVRAGATNASALKSLQSRGVEIYSIPGLHAKVLVASHFGWVGSANASKHSAEALVEAAIRIDQSDVVEDIRNWASSLCTDSAFLSRKDVSDLAKIEVSRRMPRPKRLTPTINLPKSVDHLHVLWTQSDISQAAKTAAQAEEPTVCQQTGLKGSELAWLEWSGQMPDGLTVGCYVVEIRGGKPRRHPTKVVRISNRGDFSLIWLTLCTTVRKPRQADVAQQVRAWERNKDLRLDSSEANAVLDLYR